MGRTDKLSEKQIEMYENFLLVIEIAVQIPKKFEKNYVYLLIWFNEIWHRGLFEEKKNY